MRFTLLAAILLVGALLRFSVLDFGFPDFYHPDEPTKARVVQGMMKRGDLDPRYFRHPTALLYGAYALSTVAKKLGARLPERQRIILSGRAVSAAAGTATILLLYALGCRLSGQIAGFVAATLLAVTPLHVTCSRYFKEDSLLVFFLFAAFLCLLSAKGRKNLLYLAGTCFGFAAGVKYSGLLGVPLLLLFPLVRREISFRTVLVACVFIPIGFLLFCPYALITPEKFLEGVLSERSHILSGHSIVITMWDARGLFHLTRSFLPGMGVIPLLAATAGVVLLLWRRRPEDLYLVLALFLFYGAAEWIKAKPFPQPERYVLPCVPILCLAVGELIGWLRERSGPTVALLLTLVTVLVPGHTSTVLALELRDDTRAKMERWIGTNIAPGSSFLLDGSYTPRLEDYSFRTKLIHSEGEIWRIKPGRLKRSGFQYFLTTSFAYDRFVKEPLAPKLYRSVYTTIFSTLKLVHEEKAPGYGFHNPIVRLYALE